MNNGIKKSSLYESFDSFHGADSPSEVSGFPSFYE
jgi:hypothetical protein